MADPTQDDQITKEEEVVEQPTQDEAQDTSQEEVQPEVNEQQEEEQLEEDAQEPEQVESPQETQPEERPPSRREQLRIQNLLRKYPNLREEVAPQTENIDYRKMIDADDGVYDRLSQVSQQFGNQQYQAGLKEANKVKFETRLEVDAPRVASKHPQLDKDSDQFNGAVADSLNTMYLSAVGYDEKTGYVSNPNLRYADYIDAMFELVQEAASRQVETTRKNVTRQAARTGLRPDGSSGEKLDLTKPFEAMTDKELAAWGKRNGLAPTK